MRCRLSLLGVVGGFLGSSLAGSPSRDSISKTRADGSLCSLDFSDAAPLQPTIWDGDKYGCKCYVGEPCWPSSSDWNKLNTTVAGNLIVNIPPGAACHNTFQGPLGTIDTYSAAGCADVNANWGNETWT